MALKGDIKVEIVPKDDGSFEVKCDCSKVIGSEAEIKKMLDGLRAEFGANLTIEKHVHKHGHSHDDSNHHRH
jgi:hypothetical protein